MQTTDFNERKLIRSLFIEAVNGNSCCDFRQKATLCFISEASKRLSYDCEETKNEII